VLEEGRKDRKTWLILSGGGSHPSGGTNSEKKFQGDSTMVNGEKAITKANGPAEKSYSSHRQRNL